MALAHPLPPPPPPCPLAAWCCGACSGNAMLVGVGGSGKQSLARLAAHICGCEVVQIAVSSTYGVADFKEALLGLYTKVGAAGGLRSGLGGSRPLGPGPVGSGPWGRAWWVQAPGHHCWGHQHRSGGCWVKTPACGSERPPPPLPRSVVVFRRAPRASPPCS